MGAGNPELRGQAEESNEGHLEMIQSTWVYGSGGTTKNNRRPARINMNTP